MESEHSMALEERDGSGIEREFISMSPWFSGVGFMEEQE
jgi:hypothetical protein